jgi:hypothetical protein
MTDQKRAPPQRPARREPMLWLVVGLPALVVAASLLTVWISARSGANDAVADDVRRTAQIQTTELAPDEAAAKLGLSAVLSVQDSTVVVVPVTGSFPQQGPLSLRFAHPVEAERDILLRLQPIELGWSAPAKVDAGNDWNVTLQDNGGDWRILGRLPAGQQAVRLAPALAAQ